LQFFLGHSFDQREKIGRYSLKKIKILFIHPNFPGQFKHLVNDLVKVPNAELAFITSRANSEMKGVNIKIYTPTEVNNQNTNRYLKTTNSNLFDSQEVVRAALKLKKEGFIPAVIVGHVGWASTVFMKDIFPNTKIVGYCEWFFTQENSWENFIGETLSVDRKLSIRMQNTPSILGVQNMDIGVSPMYWQRDSHPEYMREKIEVIHEGVDTDICRPQERSVLNLPGVSFEKDVKLVTYISRSLEPARGFFTFLEAVKELCKRDKTIQFVVVGRERSAYSPSTGDGDSYKKQAMEKFECDWSRVHFVGKVSYESYLEVLRNSMVHIHLSAPLFLSWSLLEAMSSGCSIVSSDNAPVTEVIEHDVNGKLVPFFNADRLADEVMTLLEDRDLANRLSENARKTVLDKYNKASCVNQWKQLILRAARL